MRSDGRNLAPDRAVLAGEGAQQRVRDPGAAFPVPQRLFDPELPRERGGRPTYHGLPLLKEPVWLPTIAVYFYAGGVSGCSAALAAAIDLAGGAALERLGARVRWLAVAGGIASTAILVHDLGRPTRFLHMLRVFRPTSPMSVGAWLLAGFGGAATAAAILGPRRLPGRLAAWSAGLLGLPLATYTAALVANTAVPVWQESRRALPLLFAASAASGTASLLELLDLDRREARAVRVLAIGGKAAELVCGRAVEREAGRVERVARPLHRGASGALWKAAKILTAASLALDLAPVRGHGPRRAAGALGTLASLALRFSVFTQGRASARDPRAVSAQQRASGR